jgi:uncharacterized protein DUF1566
MKSSGFILGAMMLLAMLAFASTVLAGDLNPPGAPAPTMKTLDEIPGSWHRILRADDGVTTSDQPDPKCNSSRFKCVLGGAAVLDKETGLVWEQSLEPSVHTWQDAQAYCFGRYHGDRGGWGLPRMEELSSILPLLPAGHPFANINTQSTDFYWSATTLAGDATQAWALKASAAKGWRGKTETHLVWCVRGGHGHDGR